MSRPITVGAMCVALCLAVLALAGCGGRSESPAQAIAAIGHGSTPRADLAAAVPSATPSPTNVPPTRTATARPTPAPTATATFTPLPTPAPTSTPTATPIPRPVQLTSGGCCTQPFWSADSQQVRFIDKPDRNSPTGIWGVPIAEPGAKPMLVTERVEESLAVGDYLVDAKGNRTVIQRLSDGKAWTVPAGGRAVLISPTQTRIAWSAVNADLPPEQQVASIWVAQLDGSGARKVATLRRGGLSGWISDDKLLISGEDTTGPREQVLWALSTESGETLELARAERLRSASLSPSGTWVAYYVAFDADPSRNGLWLARTDGAERKPVATDLFGAYQWRPCGAEGACSAEDERLLIVPFDPAARFHELWELDANSDEVRPLTLAATTPFKIANGDWRVSPDGRYVAYVESSDRNIWIIELPSRTS